MTANQTLGRQAWRVLTHETRRSLYVHMDIMHQLAQAHWHRFPGNILGTDAGPFELNECDWYRRNSNWGPWLKLGQRWATKALKGLSRLLADLEKQCALSRLLFKDENPCMDETLYLALEETKELLACYISGWRVMLRNMTLDEWCWFGVHNEIEDT